MNDTEMLSVRLVRFVHAAAPKAVTSKQARDHFPNDKAGNIYATLLNLTQFKGSPLIQIRPLDAGDIVSYKTRLDFDLETWLKEYSKKSRARRTPDPGRQAEGGDEDAQIVKVLLEAARRDPPQRLTAIGIYNAGHFVSRESMVCALPALSDSDGPLVRERDTSAAGAPFVYGIRPGIDVEAWLRDRAEEPEDPLHLAFEPARPLSAAKPPAPSGLVETKLPAKPAAPPAPPAPPKPEAPTRRPSPIFARVLELTLEAEADLLAYIEVNGDPIAKTKAKQVRLLRELGVEFQRMPFAS